MAAREFQIVFQTDRVCNMHFHQDVELLYVMEGEILLKLAGSDHLMRSEDFVIINSNHRHSWTTSGDTAVFVIHFDLEKLRDNNENRLILFHCDSTLERDGRYEYIRSLLEELLSEFAVSGERFTYRKKGLIYDLLDYMVRYFMVNETSEISRGDDLRVEKMLQYIQANYQQPLSLKEMAAYMYMASSSFSRYFRKAAGESYLEYINHLRLHHALEDLCYTNDSVAWISEKHGFANASSFCRIFKAEYGHTPMAYRRQFNEKRKTQGDRTTEVLKYLKKYKNKENVKSTNGYRNESFRVECDVHKVSRWDNPWNIAMNLGFAHELSQSFVQKQIREAKIDLRFNAGRICAPFAEKMMLRKGHDPHITFYFNLDLVLDLLVENGIIPIISLDNKQESILRGVNEIIYESGVEKPFESMEEFLSVLKDFLDHVVLRYGMREVSRWIFECWYDTYRGTVMGLKVNFISAFEEISKMIKSVIPSAEVGGWGISSAEGKDGSFFRQFMEEWGRAEIKPDFVSMNLFPYVDAGQLQEKRESKRLLNNVEYYTGAVQRCRQKMDECGLQNVPIYVSEWNTSISKRNYYNETCGKASLILQMIAELDTSIQYAAYMELTDFSGIYHDIDSYMYGGRGLLNVFGVRKPAYYAFRYLRQLQPCLIYKDSHTIITSDGHTSYVILCFNAKRLKYSYYIKEEGELKAGEVGNVFENEKNLEITFCLNNVENGMYNVREYSLCPHKGSSLYEWYKLGPEEKLDPEDYEYLREISRPARRRAHISVTQNKLIMLQTLEANEIRMLKISK